MTQKVESGNTVVIEYTGTLDDGKVFDSTDGREPFEFTAGEGRVIKGFDDAVVGMQVGEEKEFKVTPEEGYGPHMEQLIQKVPKTAFPGDMDVKEGMMLQMQSPEGRMMVAKVIKIEAEEVTLDLNHPLAGQNLNFKITVKDVKEGAPAEDEPADEDSAEESADELLGDDDKQ